MNFKGVFGIYDKPDVQKIYTAFEIAELLDTSVENVRNIAERHEARLNKKKQQAITKRLEKTPQETAALEDHSLVTDKRCLDFNYWPDVVPDCFKECEG